MPASQEVAEAVRAAIVASAHVAAYEHVPAAAPACERLGSMSGGRWRSAARELAAIQDDLQKVVPSVTDTVATCAEDLGLPEESLWTVGDAAGTLDLLRDGALAELEQDGPAARLLRGEVVFGAALVEDQELPDRGTTLLFSWAEPLSPASWPWQANWVITDEQSDGDENAEADELDLFEAGELEGEDAMLPDLAGELGCSRQEARVAVRDAAMAITRASLLAGAFGQGEEPDEEDDGAN